jgi:hypothetical protein
MKLTSYSVVALSAFLALPGAARAQAPSRTHSDHEHERERAQTARGVYTFRLTPATSLAPFAGAPKTARQDVLRVGTFKAADGNVTGHSIATTDDGMTTVVVDFTWSGTYTVNTDGTGSLSITTVNVTDASCTPAQTAGQCATFEVPETFAFVLNGHGEDKTISLIETDNQDGGPKIFLTGDAKRRY